MVNTSQTVPKEAPELATVSEVGSTDTLITGTTYRWTTADPWSTAAGKTNLGSRLFMQLAHRGSLHTQAPSTEGSAAALCESCDRKQSGGEPTFCQEPVLLLDRTAC